MASNWRRLRASALHWLGMSAWWWHYPERCVMRDCKRGRRRLLTCGHHYPAFAAGRWET